MQLYMHRAWYTLPIYPVDLQANIAEDQFPSLIAPRGGDTIHPHTGWLSRKSCGRGCGRGCGRRCDRKGPLHTWFGIRVSNVVRSRADVWGLSPQLFTIFRFWVMKSSKCISQLTTTAICRLAYPGGGANHIFILRWWEDGSVLLGLDQDVHV